METFLGPEMAPREASAIWAQKSRDFQGQALPMPRGMDLPASKPLTIKTGTLVILCTRVCLQLCGVLCGYCYGRGGEADLPTPTHTTVGIHAEMDGGVGGAHSYIIFDPLTPSQLWKRLFRTTTFSSNLPVK